MFFFWIRFPFGSIVNVVNIFTVCKQNNVISQCHKIVDNSKSKREIVQFICCDKCFRFRSLFTLFRPRLHDAGRISKCCPAEFCIGLQNGKVCNSAVLKILPAPCERSLPVEFYIAFITRLIYLMLAIVLIVLSILIDC